MTGRGRLPGRTPGHGAHTPPPGHWWGRGEGGQPHPQQGRNQNPIRESKKPGTVDQPITTRHRKEIGCSRTTFPHCLSHGGAPGESMLGVTHCPWCGRPPPPPPGGAVHLQLKHLHDVVGVEVCGVEVAPHLPVPVVHHQVRPHPTAPIPPPPRGNRVAGTQLVLRDPLGTG